MPARSAPSAAGDCEGAISWPRLVASDLDGTLLRADGSVSARTQAVLARLRAAGIPFVMATGRSPSGIASVLASVTSDHPVICANGAAVVAADGRRVLAEWTITPATLAFAMDAIRSAVPGAAFAVERSTSFLHEPGYPRPAGGRPARQAGQAEIAERPATKLLVRRPGQELPLHAVSCAVGALLTVTHSGMAGLAEISAAGVTKASGLAWVAGRLGVRAPEVLAFGDMPNDIPMLRWAGRGVAMSGGHPEAVAAADAVTSSSDEDGIACYLERTLDRLGQPTSPS